MVSLQVDYMYGFMRRVLAEIGPRESCGEGERRLSSWLLREWPPIADRIWREPFTCHPRAFLGSLNVSVVCFFVAAALYWAGLPSGGLPFALACPLPILRARGQYAESSSFLRFCSPWHDPCVGEKSCVYRLCSPCPGPV
jgi:hypothetical protein